LKKNAARFWNGIEYIHNYSRALYQVEYPIIPEDNEGSFYREFKDICDQHNSRMTNMRIQYI
jgi:hypothetical protein